MAIFYYVPENNTPSWGAGMIYYHVWLLCKNNIHASAIHDKKPYKLDWLKLDLPIRYLDDKGFTLHNEDYLVIPEFYADLPQLVKLKCRKIVFVQNAFYIFDGLKNGRTYEDLAIERLFYYMPHLKKILQQITALPLFETPPFIAPYFFKEKNINQRKQRIVLYPKFNNRDYDILKRMLQDKLGLKEKKGIQKWLPKFSGWEIVELKNKSHPEVAEEMKEAAFFVSLNTTEAFNSAVPEAMAAGCINICYEGVGPADFLENNTNAYVFSNNHIYPMVEKIIYLITNFDEYAGKLNVVRKSARETADTYTIDKLEDRLVAFFKTRRQTE